MIRTKGIPLVLQGFQGQDLRNFLENSVEKYVENYHSYFKRQNDASLVKKVRD